MFISAILFFFSIITLWFSSGLVVNSVDKFARKLRVSAFTLSFFILGLLTSLPETSIGVNAIIDKEPEIFVGNLLGGVIVIFLFVIPILGIFGNGIKIRKDFEEKNLIFALLVIAAPTFLLIDDKIGIFDALLLILLYGTLLITLIRKQSKLEYLKSKLLHPDINLVKDTSKIVLGIVLLILSSNILVDQTMKVSNYFKVSPFVISLLLLSLAANIPELSLAIRSLYLGKKEIALGHYIGSASVNTLLIGVLSLLNGGVVLYGNYISLVVFLSAGLVTFYYFTRSKYDISRYESIALLSLYILFMATEVIYKNNFG